MALEQDPSTGEIYADAGRAARWFDVDLSTIKTWKKNGKAILHDGKVALKATAENISGGPSELLDDGAEITENTDEKTLDRLNKFEEYRAKRFKNEIDRGDSVRKKDLLPFFRQWSKHVGREHDAIEGTLDGTLIECPNCDNQMRLDGRGRQRIREAVIQMKNYLHDLHKNIESAKSK